MRTVKIQLTYQTRDMQRGIQWKNSRDGGTWNTIVERIILKLITD
jgi:hypothetical protein